MALLLQFTCSTSEFYDNIIMEVICNGLLSGRLHRVAAELLYALKNPSLYTVCHSYIGSMLSITVIKPDCNQYLNIYES